jgi:hypothetical protein
MQIDDDIMIRMVCIRTYRQAMQYHVFEQYTLSTNNYCYTGTTSQPANLRVPRESSPLQLFAKTPWSKCCRCWSILKGLRCDTAQERLIYLLPTWRASSSLSGMPVYARTSNSKRTKSLSLVGVCASWLTTMWEVVKTTA